MPEALRVRDGPPKLKVVLRAAVNVVERLRVVGRDVIELRDWQVLFEIPVRAAIVTLINAAVATNQVMIGVGGIDPDFVVVDVLRSFTQTSQRAATVV